MSSSLDTASASDAERRTKRPRLRGRRRILTVASIALALLGGSVAESGAAFAQPPSAQCPAACYAGAPAGVQQVDWDDANEAATWWANNNVDFNAASVRSGWSWYHRIDAHPGGGWPDSFWGQNWYAFYEPGIGRDQFIYYGGTFHDRAGLVTQAERNHGVSSNDAWQSSAVNGNSPYVEYDIDYYGSANDPRNARRLVRNTRTGNVYATFDHYQTFYYLGHF
ncbi:hypothetical protein GCM10022403_033340 [Streptomyces coacervatus]|uniref:Uncharacterized protein n=1 Tax=Streptomyces coacervatus TaxID=647381 RepID=A0ABP7HN43_9ACTN|nr:ribonuclease domain-containing protein [Streptomyces coacervatus]MDF2272337.1 ribonuclease domain-containing protein [Streptomyces coacervatus]